MRNVTVLFQGQYNPQLLRVAQEIKKRCDGMSVVISCWESDRRSVPEELGKIAKLVFSIDPGSVAVPGHKLDNVRRQLVSTQAGLSNVDTEYVLKLRTDIQIDWDRIDSFIGLCVELPPNEKKIFERKVIVTSLTTLDADRSKHYFHVCDWIYLGLTDDIRAMFDSAAIPGNSYFQYFQSSMPELEIVSQFRSEAYIVYSFVKQRGVCNDYLFSGHVSEKIKEVSASVLKENFTVVNPWNWGLKSEKHSKLFLWMQPDRYSEADCRNYWNTLPVSRRLYYAAQDCGARLLTKFAVRLARLKRKTSS